MTSFLENITDFQTKVETKYFTIISVNDVKKLINISVLMQILNCVFITENFVKLRRHLIQNHNFHFSNFLNSS